MCTGRAGLGETDCPAKEKGDMKLKFEIWRTTHPPQRKEKHHRNEVRGWWEGTGTEEMEWKMMCNSRCH